MLASPICHSGLLHSSTTSRTASMPLHHPCEFDPAPTTSLQWFQQLGVAPAPGTHTRLELTGKYSSVIATIYNLSLVHPSHWDASLLTWPILSSTLKYTLAIYGFSNPTKDTLLQYVNKGIKRFQGEVQHLRQPITTSILQQLKTHLHHCSDLEYHDKCMLWAAFCLAL